MSRYKTRRSILLTGGAVALSTLAGCVGMNGDDGMDPQTESMTDTESGMVERAAIDRFSEDAGMLMVRSDENGLPGPDEPIDFDQGPFITTGLGPDGTTVQYYNFDVMSTTPAPIFALFREGENMPVKGQDNIIGVIPGDNGYNDFWQVHTVTVPSDYEVNSIRSVEGIRSAGYEIMATDMLVNCPVVPEGSTAEHRMGDGATGLIDGWYKGMRVSYFTFEEAPLSVASGKVPLSPIYVSFNKNPGEDGGGPPSGFRTEMGSDQTHNVVATVPGDQGYSPLWSVNIYNNADFGMVSDLDTAMDAEILAEGAATVNCPVVSVEE